MGDGCLEVHPVFLVEEFVFGLYEIGVWDAAIDWAYGGALGFFMETCTLGAFVWDDVIDLVGDGCLRRIGGHGGAVAELDVAFEACAVGKTPLYAGFIDGSVRALGFAGAAVNTFFSNNNGHVGVL